MGFRLVPSAVRVAAIGLLLALTGCITVPPQQSYNREANTRIKTIRVLPMRASETGLFFNNPAMQFGLVGALIAAGDMAAKRSTLEKNLIAAHFDHEAIFKARFTEAMQHRGYTLLWPTPISEGKINKAPREGWGVRKTYMAVEQADAQLDVNFGFIGYAASGAGKAAPYRPTVSMSARLVSADGKSKLFSETLNYNPLFIVSADSISISPDPSYAYPNFSDLEKSGPASAEGLKAAVEAVADKIAEQL